MMTRTFQVIAGTSLVIASNYEDPNIMKIEGYCNGVANTQYFLQIFNQTFASLVSTTMVPLRSLQVLGADGFTFSYMDEGMSTANLPGALASSNANWIVVLSTTDAVYTAPAGGQTCDINVDVEEYEIEVAGTTTSAQATSAANYQVVADASGNTNKLISLSAVATGAICYLQLFAIAPTVNAVPIEQLIIPGVATGLLPLTTPTLFKFGTAGKSFFQQDSNGTGHYGIFIAFSLTSGLYDGAGAGNIIAIYK